MRSEWQGNKFIWIALLELGNTLAVNVIKLRSPKCSVAKLCRCKATLRFALDSSLRKSY